MLGKIELGRPTLKSFDISMEAVGPVDQHITTESTKKQLTDEINRQQPPPRKKRRNEKTIVVVVVVIVHRMS